MTRCRCSLSFKAGGGKCRGLGVCGSKCVWVSTGVCWEKYSAPTDQSTASGPLAPPAIPPWISNGVATSPLPHDSTLLYTRTGLLHDARPKKPHIHPIQENCTFDAARYRSAQSYEFTLERDGYNRNKNRNHHDHSDLKCLYHFLNPNVSVTFRLSRSGKR
jgi:hypothetical protein